MLRRRRAPRTLTPKFATPKFATPKFATPKFATPKFATPKFAAPKRESALDGFHEWLLSLPWVTERPYSLDTPGVRCFAVDCAPLARRQLWLITGLQQHVDANGIGLAVILPTDAAHELEDVGRGRILAPMPARQSLVTVYGASSAGREELEAVALSAYACAFGA